MSSVAVRQWVIPAAEIVTVGLPFCVFKLCTGAIALHAWPPLGYLLLALGSVDAVLNIVNLGALLVVRRRVSAVCVAQLAFRRDLGLATDVFLSFGLVAIVIGAGLMVHVPAWAVPIWNLAVVLNVLGAGVGRLVSALRK